MIADYRCSRRCGLPVERISEGEQAVVGALWAADIPLTAAEVAERVDPTRGWSEWRTFAAGESGRRVDRLFAGRAFPLVAHPADEPGLTQPEIAEREPLIRS